MADLLLSPLIKIVVQKSGDLLVQRISEMWGIDDQCKTLEEKLLAVQDVLTDAEDQGNAKPSVKSWLSKLKSATYDADDILDEFHYEELRRDAMRRGHKVGNVSGCFFLENPILFRFKMSRKLKEVVGRIDELVTEMERFKFVQGRQGRVVDRDRTHSYVIESEVVGRGDDKEKLVKLLTKVHPSENLTVLPVVGMGGLGKTTLAQLAYNDPRIKEHFKLLVWVCVSDEFDVGAITKLIIDSVIQKDCKVSRENMELLQIRLRQEISGKRYILVLDDVWNENVSKWEQLRVLLNCGDLGSSILVTTRSGRVATIMGTIESYNLRSLDEEDSWRMFRKRAFSKGVKECQGLVEIGRKMVHNCRGLPLAINTLGSLMSCKFEEREWLAVLEECMMQEHRPPKDEVLSVLRLSYDHLPSYMKQCFAFCAVYPKDYKMEKEKLIQFWIAHGFIPTDRAIGLETRGSEIFNELAWRSFFQDVEQDFRKPNPNKWEHGYRSLTTCKMHDLMHDLAQSVMRDECLSLFELSEINNKPQCNVRHITLANFPKDISKAIEYFPTTRSLIATTKRLFSVQKNRFVKSNSLRVLELSAYNIFKTFTTFGKTKHLRYLDLSCFRMTTITEAITSLYLLQTLRLLCCSDLTKLPKGMRYMKSLRHLIIENCSLLRCMPKGLGDLKFLQTLTYYIVGTGVGNKLEELKTLNLGGQLKVYNLSEVRDATDAREANMVSKQNLDHLVLCWGMLGGGYSYSEVDSSQTVVADFDVMDALKPCNKLKILEIEKYRGDKFPIWMTEYQMLENIVELYITECQRCTNVPPMHKLPHLQKVNIESMDNLRHLCCGAFMRAEGSEDAPITFPSLKSLTLYNLPNLDCWCEGDVGEKTSLIFPILSLLSIRNCPKLSAVPAAPLLEVFTIGRNNSTSCFAAGLTAIEKYNLGGRTRPMELSPFN